MGFWLWSGVPYRLQVACAVAAATSTVWAAAAAFGGGRSAAGLAAVTIGGAATWSLFETRWLQKVHRTSIWCQAFASASVAFGICVLAALVAVLTVAAVAVAIAVCAIVLMVVLLSDLPG